MLIQKYSVKSVFIFVVSSQRRLIKYIFIKHTTLRCRVERQEEGVTKIELSKNIMKTYIFRNKNFPFQQSSSKMHERKLNCYANHFKSVFLF